MKLGFTTILPGSLQRNIFSVFAVSVFAVLLFTSCSNTKYLPRGETLYTGSKIKYISSQDSTKEVKAVLKEELQSIILPKPNGSLFGLRIKLWLYNIAGTPTGKGLRYFVRNKLGEPPVYTTEISFEKNRTIMANRLQNRGYFQSSVRFDTATKDKRTSGIFYVKPGVQYIIDTVNFPADSSELSAAIRSVTGRSGLRSGRPFDLDVIKEQRERINDRLKQRGYFYFNETYLLVKVDSSLGTNKVNMYVEVKPETPQEARHPYRINDIIIYADYSLASDTAFSKDKAILYDSFYVVDPYKKFNPRMFKRNIRFHPGDLYNRRDHNLTLNRLVSLGVYKFVKARFEKVDTVEARRLNSFYYLSPNNTWSAKAQVSLLTKSNNSNGTDVTVSLKNRNAFHSAEQLSVSAFIGFEKQIASQQDVNTTRWGGNIDLVIPRMIGPIKFGKNSDFVPSTRVNVGYEYYRRTDQYTLNSYKTSYGWLWKSTQNIEHGLTPFNINYVLPSNITPEFQARLDTNLTLARSIEKQFIIGAMYNFTYNSQAKPNRNRHNYYFNGNADVSGNIIGIATGADVKNGKEKLIFNTPFSQYLRGEAEFRYYLSIGKPRIDNINQWASRIIVGAGYGYGNSLTMPFIKAFFVGGTNSIRAYRARSLGPGTYYGGNTAVTNSVGSPGTELEFAL